MSIVTHFSLLKIGLKGGDILKLLHKCVVIIGFIEAIDVLVYTLGSSVNRKLFFD